MSKVRFSRLAEDDLLGIADYTVRTWGRAQAVTYLDKLEARCQRLRDSPALGRLCDNVRPGLRRMAQGRHVVFYREERGGILVSRILHQSMLPDRHAFDEREDR